MLSVASVKANRVRLLGSFVALALGVTMLTMTALLLLSAQPQVPQRFAAVDIAVTPLPAEAPADTFPAHPRWSGEAAQHLAAKLSAIAGVSQAIPDKPFYAQAIINGKPVETISGNVWDTAALGGYRLLDGSAPATAREVVLPASLGLRAGETVTILTAPGPHDYRVSGLTDGPGYFFADQPNAGVPVIALLTTGEVDLTQVAQALDGQGVVLTGAGLSALESPADARTRWIGMQVLTAMGALSAFVAIFLVAATFSFSVLQRRREFGLLRAIGATPGQLRRMMLGEALLVGAVAGVCGVALGSLGAPLLGSVLVDAGFEPAGFTVRHEPLAMAAAFLTGLTVAVAGVWIAARRAAHVRPLEALRVADAERTPMTRSRWLGGSVTIVLGGLSAVATAGADALSMPTYAGLAAMLLITGISLLSPVLVPPLARVLMAPFSRSAIGLLVRQNAFTAARRTAATAAPVLLTVTFAMLVTSMVATGASAYAARRAAVTPAAAVLVPAGTPGLTGAAVAAVDGVSLLPTTVFVGRVPLEVTGVTGREQPSPGEMTVSQSVASRHGWAPGSVADLTVASGYTVSLRVGAVVPDSEAAFGVVVRADWVPSNDPSALSVAVLLAADAAQAPGPGAKVLNPQQYAAQADAEEDRLVWTFTLILVAMAAGFALIAVANTLLMATASRTGDLRVLQKAGATTKQVLGVIAAETTLVVLIGTALGMLVATGSLLAIRAGLSEQIGRTVPLVISWPAIAVTVGLCLLAGLAASVLPARAALPRR